jgi:uncharacterized membrane protein YbhN (UPF0104 family)
VSSLVEVPRRPDGAAQRADADWVVDVALGVLGASVGGGLTVVRAVTGSTVVRSAVEWRAPFVPARLQPTALLAGLAARGARNRVWVGRGVERLLDQWTPVVAALALSVLGWSLQVATYHLTAMAAGFQIPVVGTVACLLAVNVGFAIRATPGNVGLFQMMYAVTAAAFGLDRDQAIGVAFLIQTQQILPVTALGVSLAPEFIFGRRRRLGEDRGEAMNEGTAA